jgi:hypothetical protein
MKKFKLLSRIIHMHSKATHCLYIAKRKMNDQRQIDKMTGFLLATRLILDAWYSIYGENLRTKEPKRPAAVDVARLN